MLQIASLSPALQVLLAPPATTQVQRLTAAAAHRPGVPQEIPSRAETRPNWLAKTETEPLRNQVERQVQASDGSSSEPAKEVW